MAIYLDHNATTPLAPEVRAAMQPLLTEQYGNPASATHAHGWVAEELVSVAREQVAALLHCTPKEIIFTSGSTEANNLAILGTCRTLLKRRSSKNRIVTIATEHKSVLDPITELAAYGFETTVVPVTPDGLVDKTAFTAALGKETALVSCMLANNEIGTIQPIAELAEIVRNRSDALFHCDATQAIGKIPVDVTALDVDLLSLSAHKFYGPKGAGALFVRESLFRTLPLTPLVFGGGHERGLRSGTLNTPGIVGLGVAATLAATRCADDNKRLCKLTKQILAALSEFEVTIHGSMKHRIPGNLNLSISGVPSAELIGAVATRVALSTSSACTSKSAKGSHVLAALGVDTDEQKTAIRITPGRYSTAEEVATAAEIIRAACSDIRR